MRDGLVRRGIARVFDVEAIGDIGREEAEVGKFRRHDEAFDAHGQVFPGVYTASLLAGEKSGNLEQVLRRYVSYVKVVSSVRRKTVSALVYPAIRGRFARALAARAS